MKTRPNYYEVLGLKPSATGDEIADAFDRENSVFRPNAVGRVAELCLAYETLRDPARRRAYDESLGLKAGPVRRGWSIAAQARPYNGQMATYAPKPAPAPEPSMNRVPSPEPRAEEVPSARQAVDGQVPGGGSVRRLSPESDVLPGGQSPISKSLPRPLVLEARMNDEVGSVEWKRTGQIVGVLIAAAIFLGSLAGWWSGRDAAAAEQPKQADPVVSASTKKVPSFAEMWATPTAPVEVRADRPRRATMARPKVRTADIEQPVRAEAEAQDAPPLQDQAIAEEQVVAEAPSAPATTAIMPLPDGTVARTIDRIGYACGKVASTVAAEGQAPGVYKVTCTSGQSFQAKPVRGRYHFRRWAKD